MRQANPEYSPEDELEDDEYEQADNLRLQLSRMQERVFEGCQRITRSVDELRTAKSQIWELEVKTERQDES